MAGNPIEVLAPFSLDRDRLEIATRLDRNVLVLAGPGAGKTHLLVAHACWLAHQHDGRAILLTYSRKAAAEMKRRADGVLPADDRRLVVASTIHAYALDLLRLHGHRIGMPGDIEPIEAKDVQSLADEVARRDGQSPMEDFASRFEKYQRVRGDLGAEGLPPLVGLVDLEMRARGRIDWDSCIRIATELLTADQSVRDSVKHHDRSVLLDEAQDCDANQLTFLEQLLGPPPGDRHLFVVMDPDQSLYAFRQAKPELVRAWALSYTKDETEVTENFRCSPRVQALAKHVIEKPWEGALTSGTAVFKMFPDRDSEAKWLSDQVVARSQAGLDSRRMAVLARRRSRLATLEPAISARVQIRSDPREHWTPPEDRILAAVAFIKDWVDREVSPDVVATFLVEVAGFDLDAARELEREALRLQRHPGDLLTLPWWHELEEWLAERRSAEQIIEWLAAPSNAKLGDLRALRALARQARSLGDLLKLARSGPDPALVSRSDGVLVTTFHGAKGLEFDTVLIVGCEDGTIPDFRARTDAELREERRGLYVAVTRAASEVILTCVTSDNGYQKRPSRFLPALGAAVWTGIER